MREVGSGREGEKGREVKREKEEIYRDRWR